MVISLHEFVLEHILNFVLRKSRKVETVGVKAIHWAVNFDLLQNDLFNLKHLVLSINTPVTWEIKGRNTRLKSTCLLVRHS